MSLPGDGAYQCRCRAGHTRPCRGRPFPTIVNRRLHRSRSRLAAAGEQRATQQMTGRQRVASEAHGSDSRCRRNYQRSLDFPRTSRHLSDMALVHRVLLRCSLGGGDLEGTSRSDCRDRSNSWNRSGRRGCVVPRSPDMASSRSGMENVASVTIQLTTIFSEASRLAGERLGSTEGQWRTGGSPGCLWAPEDHWSKLNLQDHERQNAQAARVTPGGSPDCYLSCVPLP